MYSLVLDPVSNSVYWSMNMPLARPNNTAPLGHVNLGADSMSDMSKIVELATWVH